MVQSTMPRDRIPIHFVLNFCEAGLHCVERLKMRADMESGVMWTWLTGSVSLCSIAHHTAAVR